MLYFSYKLSIKFYGVKAMNVKKGSYKRKLITLILGGLVLLTTAGAVYLNDYYRADSDAIQAFLPQKHGQ